jgi:ABC-type transport system involved in multi-copper enzyme maturation permease subunit
MRRDRSTVSSVNPFTETRYIVQRELRKSFRSVKGIILSVLTVAGGGGLALLFAQSDELRQKRLHEKDISPEVLLEAKRKLLGWWFMDESTGQHVGTAPGLLFFLFAVSLVMMPAVVLMLGFDSISAERQHKTVRYWTVRSRRSSYILGKWLGLWATCSLVALGMHALIWIVCTVRGEAPFAQIVSWGFRFWLASLPIVGMWCAVSVFVSSLLRVPILALLTTGAIFFVWWLVYFPFWIGSHGDPEQATVPTPSAILYFFPNFYDRFILSPNIGPFLTGLAVCFGFAALMLTASSALFAKRDV